MDTNENCTRCELIEIKTMLLEGIEKLNELLGKTRHDGEEHSLGT